jgi:P pilus assembly chaperone PapD
LYVGFRRWLCVLAVVPCSVSAGTFSVNPIRLELAPTQTATSLHIENVGHDQLWLQVRVYRWTHLDGSDVLTTAQGSDEPVVTPPLFRLAPGGAGQVVRIGFRPLAAAPEERQWRVIVEELPPINDSSLDATEPSRLGESPAGTAAVSLRVRVSLPLLQRPKVIHQDLQWSLQPISSGLMQLTARNAGSVTERLDEVHLDWIGGSWRESGLQYLFPGESRTFEVRPEAAMPVGNVQLELRGTPRPLKGELVLSAQ